MLVVVGMEAEEGMEESGEAEVDGFPPTQHNFRNDNQHHQQCLVQVDVFLLVPQLQMPLERPVLSQDSIVEELDGMAQHYNIEEVLLESAVMVRQHFLCNDYCNQHWQWIFDLVSLQNQIFHSVPLVEPMLCCCCWLSSLAIFCSSNLLYPLS